MADLIFSFISPSDIEASMKPFLGKQEGDVRLLKFSNAVLARAETNANRDTVDDEGLEDVAATIVGTAIDLEHKPRQVVGFYTGGRVDGHALLTDGVIFADRFPEVAAGVQDGTYRLSIEARAEEAVCSMCGGKFKHEREYCAHLAARVTSGATRFMRGLRAKGGAVTKIPAGTNTTFDPRQIELVASLDEPTDEPEVVLTFMAEAEYSWFLLTGKVLTTDDRKNMKDEQFGVIQKGKGKNGKAQKRRRFPLNDREHATLALQMLPKAKNLSSDERSKIKKEARAKLKETGGKSAMNGAQRAAQMLVAEVSADITKWNPSGYTDLVSPVLAPMYFFPPYPAWVEGISNQPSAPVKPTAAMQANLSAAEGPTPASVAQQLEGVKRDLLKLFDSLEQQLKAARPREEKQGDKLGVIGLDLSGSAAGPAPNGNSAKRKASWA